MDQVPGTFIHETKRYDVTLRSKVKTQKKKPAEFDVEQLYSHVEISPGGRN